MAYNNIKLLVLSGLLLLHFMLCLLTWRASKCHGLVLIQHGFILFIPPSEFWEAVISCCPNPVEYTSLPQGQLYSSVVKGLIKTCEEMDLFFSFYSILVTLGQNESGVAVHNERIYLVGGYSIWTNEPLACIQVSG